MSLERDDRYDEWWASCDLCGWEVNLPDWLNEKDAEKALKKLGWKVEKVNDSDESTHLCPTCKTKEDA